MARRLRWGVSLLVIVLLGVLTVMPLVVSSTDQIHAGSATTTGVIQDSPVEISSITIEQPSIRPGETATITAVVANTADEQRSLNATLALDGEQQATQRPSVNPEFPLIVSFEVTVDDPGEYTVTVNNVAAEQSLTVRSPSSNNVSDSDGSVTRPLAVTNQNVTVERVELTPTSVSPGDTVEVTAELANTGPDIVNVSLALAFDGDVVTSTTAENILSQVNNPGITTPYTFEYEPGQAGTYTVSVNGTEASSKLDVSGGDGGQSGFLGLLPLGLLRLLGLFVVFPIAVIYLVLKALAFYLGY